jgi:hypothetical protein
MGIGSDAVALRALLATLDQALLAARVALAGGAGVDEVLDARIRIREIQARRELVARRLAALVDTKPNEPS